VTSPLDLTLREVFTDRKLLGRVVRSVQLDAGGSYVDALERLHQGADDARQNGTNTLRAALERARADVAYVETSLKILERRDAAVAGAYERAAGAMMLEQIDDQGLVLLDHAGSEQATGTAEAVADVGRILTDPAEFERRYARMRRLTGAFDGPDGREQFRQLDRDYATAGKDIVRTEERRVELRAAEAKAAQAARQLDQAMASAADKRSALKALEAEVAKLPDAVSEADKQQALSNVRAEAQRAAEEPLRMLDQMPTARVSRVESSSSDEERLDRLRLTQSPAQFARTLEAYIAGEPLADLPVDPAEQPREVPAGVHAGSHGLHQRVLDRIRELDRNPDRDYARTLDEIIREGA
jgi:hypothetical protein